jgi:hypothetical protein
VVASPLPFISYHLYYLLNITATEIALRDRQRLLMKLIPIFIVDRFEQSEQRGDDDD